MALEDSRRGARVETDVLLHRIDSEIVAYRMVRHWPPHASDFRSHYEPAVKPDPTKPFRAYEWFGVSMFVDPARVDRLVEHARRRGGGFRARMLLRPREGLFYVYNSRTSHVEVFGFPDSLLEMVEGVD
jgi:hypothetical protein